MRLENSFDVPATPDQAWALLLDVPRVIPCMPGAELIEVVDASTWKAKLTVKLGPMGFSFDTDVNRESLDEAGHRSQLSATAREKRGRGQARATILSTLTAVPDGTRVEIVTDLALSGAVAQYARGMVQDVAGQLTAQFADCLRRQLAAERTVTVGAAEPAAPAEFPAPVRPVSGTGLLLSALRSMLLRSLRLIAGRG